MRVCDKCRLERTVQRVNIHTDRVTDSGRSLIKASKESELCAQCVNKLETIMGRTPVQIIEDDEYYHKLLHDSRRDG